MATSSDPRLQLTVLGLPYEKEPCGKEMKEPGQAPRSQKVLASVPGWGQMGSWGSPGTRQGPPPPLMASKWADLNVRVSGLHSVSSGFGS